jgi:hypothetical protein
MLHLLPSSRGSMSRGTTFASVCLYGPLRSSRYGQTSGRPGCRETSGPHNMRALRSLAGRTRSRFTSVAILHQSPTRGCVPAVANQHDREAGFRNRRAFPTGFRCKADGLSRRLPGAQGHSESRPPQRSSPSRPRRKVTCNQVAHAGCHAGLAAITPKTSLSLPCRKTGEVCEVEREALCHAQAFFLH